METQDYHALALAPGNPDTVFFGHHGGILESLDGGKTWNKISGLSQDAMNLAVSHENPEVMYLAGHNVFMKSGDGGQTWRDIQNNLPGLDLHWFAPDPDNSSRLYANAAGFGLHQSSDGGVTWTPWDLQIPGDASVSALTVLGGRPVNVLAGTEDGNLFLSSDGAASWEQVGTVNSMPMAFALNPDGVTIYLGSMDGVYRSEDKGLSWTRLPLETRVMALAAGGLNPERVVVVNDKGEVFRSDDGGQTW
ncbi:MAG: hypothetical protein HQ475_11965 [SAR202 cluster bacterium]|nr:hypothetical protein [SAR202 cluster bacterium]